MSRNNVLEFVFELHGGKDYLNHVYFSKFLDKITDIDLEFDVNYCFNVYVVSINGDKSLYSNDWVMIFSFVYNFSDDIDRDKSLEHLYYEFISRFNVEDNYMLDGEGVVYHNYLCLTLNR